MTRPRPRLEPGDRRHGTHNGYVNHGCRCDACCAGHTDWTREANWRRRVHQPMADYRAALRRSHGTRSTYRNGCRCDDCRQAERRYRAEYRARRRVALADTRARSVT